MDTGRNTLEHNENGTKTRGRLCGRNRLAVMYIYEKFIEKNVGSIHYFNAILKQEGLSGSVQ